MARSYAQIYLTIWNDPDFRGLSREAQHLYFVMLTHPSLTSCGVLDWRENRLINLCEGWTVEQLRDAAWQLGQRKLIAVDPDTEEALVRSFVRHDGILKSPNKAKALVREHGEISSLRILELVSREVRRAIESEPFLKGSEVANPVAKQFPEPITKGFIYVPDWFKNDSQNDTKNGGSETGKGSKLVPSPSSLIPHPSTDVENTCVKSDELIPQPGTFAEFWDAYPKDDNEFGAAQAWTEATKYAPPGEIIKAARAYAADPNLPEMRWIPQAKTWLKERRWTQGPLKPQASQQQSTPLSRSDQAYLAEVQRLRAEEVQQAGMLEIGGATQ